MSMPEDRHGVRLANRKLPRLASKWEKPDFFCSSEVLLWRLGDQCVLYGVFAMNEFDDVFEEVSKGHEKLGPDDPDFVSRFPRVARLMTATVLPSGQPRQTSTLIIVFEEGLFKGGLRERDRDVSLWQSSSTMDGLLLALEEALARKPVDWRRSQDRGGKRK